MQKSNAKAAQQFIGYVIGTSAPKTIKVRVPKAIYLPKFQKSITRHVNYQVHDETQSCLVGDVVRIVRGKRLDWNKCFAVAERVKQADRFIDEQTKLVYTNGHLTIPVGYVDEDGAVKNYISRELHKKMGLV